jgi:cytidylate kinase
MGTYIKEFEKFENSLKIKKSGITITVSGGSGSGKTTISESIAKLLGLKHKSVGDIFREIAKEKKINLEKFAKVRDKSIDVMADERTLELAKKGNIVLNGRLTGWVAGDNADFRIFVTCDVDLIAKRVALRDKKTFEEAKKDVLMRDKNDGEQYRKIYGVDIKDHSIYDMVIDNTKLDYEAAKRIPAMEVKEILKKKGLL